MTSITVASANPIFHSEGNCCIKTATNELVFGCKTSVIPNYITSIGTYAFYGCSGLTSIEIPTSVTNLSSWVFGDCLGLTSIEIPASIKSFSGNAFAGTCSKLESITVASANPIFHSEGNCCIITATNQLVLGCKTSVIPDYVTNIKGYAFDRCSSLTSIIIPASVTSINNYAFYGCTGVKYFKFNGDKVAETTQGLTNLKSIHVNPFATGYGSTWGGKTVVVDNPIYYKNKRICKAYIGSKRKRGRP